MVGLVLINGKNGGETNAEKKDFSDYFLESLEPEDWI